MKTYPLFLVISVFFFYSCTDQKESYLSSSATVDNLNDSETTTENNDNTSKTLKLYKIKSQQFGMLFGVMPIPDSWNIISNSKDNLSLIHI